MNRPLRIAFFVGSFPVVSETFILRQITGLIDLGHDVHIFADSRADAASPTHSVVEKYGLMSKTTFMEMPPETAPWEIPLWPLTGKTWPPGASDSILNFNRFVRALPKLTRCFFCRPKLTRKLLDRSEYGFQVLSLSAIYRLSKLLSLRPNFDIAHAHFGPVGNSFRFARELWRVPLVVSFHGYDFCTVPRKQGRHVYDKLSQTADAFTVNSDFTRSRVEQLGCPPQKIDKLPVGLDPKEFCFRERSVRADEPIRIVSVGRLVEIKGHEFVLRAVALLREKNPCVHYDLVGDGPLRSKLEALSAELGVKHHTTFHGALSEENVKRVLDAAHIFVLTSVSVEGDAEGQGLALQEAQAAGLPVIATEHGALAEGLLPGASGLLVPERDIKKLAERLQFLCEHPEKWPEMGRAGRDFVLKRYDIRSLNEQLVKVYLKVINEFNTGTK
jgi:colanic acid/amylovoran biosynthesis glycosyltransferase